MSAADIVAAAPQSVAAAPQSEAAAPEVWLVYYKPGVLGNRGPPTLIGVCRSAEKAAAMQTATQAHESAEGWDHPAIAIMKAPLGVNLVIDGEDGPLILT